MRCITNTRELIDVEETSRSLSPCFSSPQLLTAALLPPPLPPSLSLSLSLSLTNQDFFKA